MRLNILDVRGTAGNDVIYDNNEVNIITTGNGDDRIYLEGIGKKQIWGGSDKDTYIITSKYSSAEDNKMVIADFEYQTPPDKIDVSQFPNIRNISDLSIEQIYDHDIMYANMKNS